MHYVSGMHMPVPLSIVLVGFGADGNGKVNISDVDLQEWFEQLDHVLPHTRVALSDLNCQEDGGRGGCDWPAAAAGVCTIEQPACVHLCSQQRVTRMQCDIAGKP
jgi:hypothetical protein